MNGEWGLKVAIKFDLKQRKYSQGELQVVF